MQFRCVALIALWTFISGPILGTPRGSVSADRAVAQKPAEPVAKQLRLAPGR